MRTKKEGKLKESNSLNIAKENQQFPASQFTKGQRKDAEKVSDNNERDRSKDELTDKE